MTDGFSNELNTKQFYPRVKLRTKLTNTSLPESVENDFNELTNEIIQVISQQKDNEDEIEIESEFLRHQLGQRIKPNNTQPSLSSFNTHFQQQLPPNNELPYYNQNTNTPTNHSIPNKQFTNYPNSQVFSSASPVLHSNSNYSLSCFGPKKQQRQKTKFSTMPYNNIQPIPNEQYNMQQLYPNSQMNIQNNNTQQTLLSPIITMSPSPFQTNAEYINMESLALTPNPNMIHNQKQNRNLAYASSPYIQHYQPQNKNQSYIMINNKIHFSPLLHPSKPKHINHFEQQDPQQHHLPFTNTNSVFQGASTSATPDEELLNNLLNKKNKKIKKAQTQTNPSTFINNINTNTLSTSQQSNDEQNKIKIEQIILLNDKRTTLMIKNIPNKYTISTFLDEINVEFKNKYDIFYLPIDYGNKCNLGFAFINFVEPFHLILFYEMYRGRKWKRFNSEKICELVYAKIQGKKELISHFEKGKVLTFESEEKRPLILPTPNPLPSIKLPMKVFELFIKTFPNVNYIADNTNAFFIVDSLTKEN